MSRAACAAVDMSRNKHLPDPELLAVIGWGYSLYELVVDAHGQAVDYVTLEVSEGCERLLGVSRSEVEGKRASQRLSPAELAYLLPILSEVGSGGQPRSFETSIPHRGKSFRCHAHCAGPSLVAIAFEDITERVQAEARLKESEARYRSLVEAADDVILLYDLQGTMLFRNSAYYRSLGFEVGEEMYPSGIDRIHPDDLEEFKRMLATIAATGSATTAEYRVLHRDGRYLTRIARFSIARDVEGNATGLVCVVRDVTERKWMEDALRDGLAFNQMVLDTAPVGILTYSKTGQCLSANLAAAQILGRTMAEVLTRNLRDMVGSGRADLEALAAVVLAQGKNTEQEVHDSSSGRDLWLRMNLARFLDGDQVRLLVVFQDISQNKRAEAELRASRERLDLALRSAQMGVWHWDLQQGKRVFDAQVMALLGIDPATFTGTAEEFFGVVHPDDRHFVEAALALTLKTDAPYQTDYRAIWRDGSVHHVQARGRLTRDELGMPARVNGVIWDVTDRKRTEAALREADSRYRLLVENISDVIWVLDLETARFRYVSPSVERLRGYTAEEVMAQDLSHALTPESQRHMASALQERVAEWQRGVRRIYLDELEQLCKDGSTVWTEARSQYLPGEDGRFVVYGVSRDITERRAADKERLVLQEQLFQAQKMDSLGTLAGGIAHDFNNLLGVIQSGVELVMLDCDMVDSQVASNMRADLERVLRATQRAGTLVQQILSFSRKSSATKQPLFMRSVVTEAYNFMRATLPTTVEIEPRISTRGPTVGNPTQIQQVLMNLLTNASQAMPDGGRIDIMLDEVAPTPALLARHGNLEAKRLIRLSVRDSGVGIAPENLDRVFDPFFTTRPRGKGTGLGLSVVHGIVTGHGGAIEVSSVVGKGSTFDVYLPLVDRSDEATFNPMAALPGTERIMFVDDEEPLVTLNCRALGRLGYVVRGFVNSSEALAAFQATPNAFDAIVSDVTMPNLPGDVLAVEALKVRPDIPVVLVTGMSNRVTPERAKELGVKAYLDKPVSNQVLTACLRGIFDGETTP
jgi:PAS domain S-box-containing protein